MKSFEQNSDLDYQDVANLRWSSPDLGERPTFHERIRSATESLIYRTRYEVSPSKLYMGSRSETMAVPTPKSPTDTNECKEPDEILVISVRDDVPYDDAKAEIIEYIERTSDENLSIGEIARKLRLDLNAVIEVFEERGLL